VCRPPRPSSIPRLLGRLVPHWLGGQAHSASLSVSLPSVLSCSTCTKWLCAPPARPLSGAEAGAEPKANPLWLLLPPPLEPGKGKGAAAGAAAAAHVPGAAPEALAGTAGAAGAACASSPSAGTISGCALLAALLQGCSGVSVERVLGWPQACSVSYGCWPRLHKVTLLLQVDPPQPAS
jgi:hypothetical protein